MISLLKDINMKTIAIMGYSFIIPFLISCQLSTTDKENKKSPKETSQIAKTADTDTAEQQEDISIFEEQLKAIDGKIGLIEQRNLKNGLQAVGFIRVHNQDKASVTSLYGGRVQSIYISPGAIVKKGQLLATLVNPQIISLQEEYLTLIANLDLTRIELERQEELMRGNAGALKNYQNIKSQFTQQKIRKASVQKQLALAGINANKLTAENIRATISLVAPISGTISNIQMEIGGNADAGAVMANIINNAEVDLDIYIYEKDIDKVRVGQEVTFSLSNNPSKVGQAIVDKVGSSFEGENKAIAIHARIVENKNGLIDGMGVKVVVGTGSQLVSAIPTEGIVNKEGKNYLFYVAKQKVNRRENKTVIEYIFKRAQIKKGVSSLGYTQVIPLDPIPNNVKVATSGAVFIQAKMDGGNTHSH